MTPVCFIRAQLRLAVCALVLCGCGDATTSVLVEIEPTPPATDHLTLTATLPDGRQVAADFAATEPARALILVPPVAQSVSVTVSAHLGDGSSRSVSGAIDAIPHRQVLLALRFDADDASDLSAGEDLPSRGLDLAPAGDQAPPTSDMAGFLARDTFARADQALWGTASDGQMWEGDANTSSSFAIAGNAGAVSDTGLSSLQGLLGGSGITDADVRVQVALAVVDESQNGGPILRCVDSANFYKAYIDGTVFVLQKRVASTYTALQTVNFVPTAGQFYWIRLQAAGTRLRAKVWKVGDAEPAAWMLDQTDTSLVAGRVGLRAQANGAASVRFREFSAQP